MAKYKSEIKKVIHLEAVSMHKVGSISNEEMREYDEMCLVKPAVPPATRVSARKSAGAGRSGAPLYARGK